MLRLYLIDGAFKQIGQEIVGHVTDLSTTDKMHLLGNLYENQ